MDTALSVAALVGVGAVAVWQRHVIVELRRIRQELERLRDA
jgi:hypothetical protein